MGVYAALGSNVFILYLLTNALINFIHYRGGYGNIKFRCHLRLFVCSRKFKAEMLVILTSLPPSSIGIIASLNLFKAALSGVFGSPVSFFDTTPMGIKLHYSLSTMCLSSLHRPNLIEVVKRSGHYRSRAAIDLIAG